MRVKYATQVFSHTVAAAICTYVSVGCLPPSAMGTAELLFRFDSIFDCLNSSTLHATKKYRCAISEKTLHIDYLKDSIKFIRNLKVFDKNQNVTGRIKYLQGWLVTLNAIILIWAKLKTEHQFKFLFTRRLNTDALENCFGKLGSRGAIVITLLLFYLPWHFGSSFSAPSSGNCANDLDVMLAEYSKASKKKKKTAAVVSPTPEPPTMAIGPADYGEPEVTTNIVKDNAIAYVSGYLLKKSFKIHECVTCQESLVSNELYDSRKLLCYYKAFDKGEAAFGGLHVPTSSYLDYVIKLEDVFTEKFSILTKTSGSGASILKIIKSVPVPFKCCSEFPLEYLQKLFIRMQIFYTLKFANRDFSCSKPRNRKYIKITHL